MNLVTTFRAELLKTRRTSLWYLCCIAPAIAPFFMFFDFDSEEGIRQLSNAPWDLYFQHGQLGLNILSMPMFIILTCTLLPQIEYKNNTWKQVLTSPQPKGYVFVAKLLTIQVFLLLFLMGHNVFMALSLAVKYYVTPQLNLFAHTLDWAKWLKMNAATYVSVLACTAFQFWLGLRSRSFLLPIGVGVGLWILGMLMVAEFHWEKSRYFFNVIPMLVAFPKHAPILGYLLLGSLGYALFFLGVAFLEFRYQKIKE